MYCTAIQLLFRNIPPPASSQMTHLSYRGRGFPDQRSYISISSVISCRVVLHLFWRHDNRNSLVGDGATFDLAMDVDDDDSRNNSSDILAYYAFDVAARFLMWLFMPFLWLRWYGGLWAGFAGRSCCCLCCCCHGCACVISCAMGTVRDLGGWSLWSSIIC
jgi:hypothetical protein